MEKVKSRAINMMYGISKIHTNVEFTFSNNNIWKYYQQFLEHLSSLLYYYSIKKIPQEGAYVDKGDA